VNGGQVWQAGGDIQEPLGQGPPQLQAMYGPLETLPQLHPGGIAEPGALPLHAAKNVQGQTKREDGRISPGVRPVSRLPAV
jgi:hypothetical protein